MPRRSTPFQAIVRMVREHSAAPDVTITESKLLRDSITGFEREVDIVIEGAIDGEPITISIEVIEHSRPASITWVEQQLRKHQNLATNRLILVSLSGFSAQAVATVAMQAGRVEALTPEILTESGVPAVRTLYADKVDIRVNRSTLRVLVGSEVQPVEALPDYGIYMADGTLRGVVAQLANEIIGSPAIMRHVSTMAHNHPERDALRFLTAGFLISSWGLHLHQEDANEYHLVAAIELTADFSFNQTEVNLQLNRLGRHVYGSAITGKNSEKMAWVATTDLEQQTTRVQFQTVALTPAPELTDIREPPTFPETQQLEPPSEDTPTQPPN